MNTRKVKKSIYLPKELKKALYSLPIGLGLSDAVAALIHRRPLNQPDPDVRSFSVKLTPEDAEALDVEDLKKEITRRLTDNR